MNGGFSQGWGTPGSPPPVLDGRAGGSYALDVLAAHRTLSLSRNQALGGGYHLLTFEAAPPVAASAGHFAMLRPVDWSSAPLLPRPMSILSAGAAPCFLLKVVGEGSARLSAMRPGERCALSAPLGQPWAPPPQDHRPVLVAGGVGVAPLIHLAEQLVGDVAAKPAIAALYGGRSADDLPLADRLAASTTLECTTEDGSAGEQALVTAPLERLLTRAQSAGTPLQIYACGPHGMMAAVAALAGSASVPCQVSLEAPMGCGYGVCLGCAVPRRAGGYLHACLEGPCVDAATVDFSGRVM